MAGHNRKKILIIGSGILGATTAYHLVRTGHAVTVIASPKHAPTTAGSFGWINANGPEDADYFSLRVAAVAEWRNLARQIPDLPIHLNGALDWDLANVVETQRRYHALGHSCKLVTAQEISILAPRLRNRPQVALFNPTEGTADPDRIAAAVLTAACKNGGASQLAATVTALMLQGGKLTHVKTDQGDIATDYLILAAGLQSGEILASIDQNLPMKNLSGLLIRSQPLPAFLQQIVSTPGVHFWQMADGRIIAGQDLGGAGLERGAADVIDRIQSKLAPFLPTGTAIEIENHRITKRPMPADGRPVMGSVKGVKGLFIACTHSGVTLAPLIGNALAKEISTGEGDPMFSRYRLDRFQA